MISLLAVVAMMQSPYAVDYSSGSLCLQTTLQSHPLIDSPAIRVLREQDVFSVAPSDESGLLGLISGPTCLWSPGADAEMHRRVVEQATRLLLLCPTPEGLSALVRTASTLLSHRAVVRRPSTLVETCGPPPTSDCPAKVEAEFEVWRETSCLGASRYGVASALSVLRPDIYASLIHAHFDGTMANSERDLCALSSCSEDLARALAWQFDSEIDTAGPVRGLGLSDALSRCIDSRRRFTSPEFDAEVCVPVPSDVMPSPESFTETAPALPIPGPSANDVRRAFATWVMDGYGYESDLVYLQTGITTKFCPRYEDVLRELALGPGPRDAPIGAARVNSFRTLALGCGDAANRWMVRLVKDRWAALRNLQEITPRPVRRVPGGARPQPWPDSVRRQIAALRAVADTGALALREGLAFAKSPALKPLLRDLTAREDADLLGQVDWTPGPERDAVVKKLEAWDRERPGELGVRTALARLKVRMP